MGLQAGLSFTKSFAPSAIPTIAGGVSKAGGTALGGKLGALGGPIGMIAGAGLGSLLGGLFNRGPSITSPQSSAIGAGQGMLASSLPSLQMQLGTTFDPRLQRSMVKDAIASNKSMTQNLINQAGSARGSAFHSLEQQINALQAQRKQKRALDKALKRQIKDQRRNPQPAFDVTGLGLPPGVMDDPSFVASVMGRLAGADPFSGMVADASGRLFPHGLGPLFGPDSLGLLTPEAFFFSNGGQFGLFPEQQLGQPGEFFQGQGQGPRRLPFGNNLNPIQEAQSLRDSFRPEAATQAQTDPSGKGLFNMQNVLAAAMLGSMAFGGGLGGGREQSGGQDFDFSSPMGGLTARDGNIQFSPQQTKADQQAQQTAAQLRQQMMRQAMQRPDLQGIAQSQPVRQAEEVLMGQVEREREEAQRRMMESLSARGQLGGSFEALQQTQLQEAAQRAMAEAQLQALMMGMDFSNQQFAQNLAGVGTAEDVMNQMLNRQMMPLTPALQAMQLSTGNQLQQQQLDQGGMRNLAFMAPALMAGLTGQNQRGTGMMGQNALLAAMMMGGR